MTMKSIIVCGILVICVCAIITVVAKVFLYQETLGAVTLQNPQVISWDKPSTDEGWAEDVKKENLDIKPDSQLATMKESHEKKLQKFLNNDEVVACPACIRYRLGKVDPPLTAAEIEERYQDQLAQYRWEVEKLQQSIERMDNEIRLRAEGFVITDERIKGDEKLGASYPENRIRRLRP